jgi:1-acyl-sn-glycerol-3-phosphate acyltransferase
VLREGDLLAIFPEGGITRDGALQPFKGGIMKILERAQADGLAVPVIPMALTNLWGSFFSRIEQVNGERHGAAVPARLLQPRGLNVGSAPACCCRPAARSSPSFRTKWAARCCTMSD